MCLRGRIAVALEGAVGADPDGQVTIAVRDHGVGITRRADAMATAVGLGISAALATDLRIETGDAGTEVWMTFANPSEHANSNPDLGTPTGG